MVKFWSGLSENQQRYYIYDDSSILMMVHISIDPDDRGGEKNVGSLGWMLLLNQDRGRGSGVPLKNILITGAPANENYTRLSWRLL